MVRANPANCSAELGSTFVGLERLYCQQAIRASHDAGECAVAFPSGGAPWTVERGQLMQARSEEHTAELQSLMGISYSLLCLKKHTKGRHIVERERSHAPSRAHYSNGGRPN